MQPVVVAAVDLAKSGPAPVAPSAPPGVEVAPYSTDRVPGRLALSVEEQPRRSVALRNPAAIELAQVPRLVPTTDNKLGPLNEAKTADRPIAAVITSPEAGAQDTVVAHEVESDDSKPSVGTGDSDMAVVAHSDEFSSRQAGLDAEFRREGAPAIEAAEITGPKPVPLTKIADLPEVASYLATSVEEEQNTALNKSASRKQSSRRKTTTAKRRGRPKARTADAMTVSNSYPDFDSRDQRRRRHHLSAMR
jgi:hypothetical protein